MKEWVWPWIFAVLIAILVYSHTDGLNYNVYHMLRFWFSQKTCYQFLVKVNHKPHFHCLPRIRADLNKPYILFQFIWQYIVILIWFGLVSDNTKKNFWHFQRITLGLPNKMIGIRQDILECVSMHERIGHGKEKPIPTWKCSDFRLQIVQSSNIMK